VEVVEMDWGIHLEFEGDDSDGEEGAGGTEEKDGAETAEEDGFGDLRRA
jgi:hypothetical protein